jgi:hypothetical protein
LAPVAGKLTYDIRAAETEELIKENSGVGHLIFLYNFSFLAGSSLTPSDIRRNLKDGIEEVWNKVLKSRPNWL